jgi:fatty-acyl-CoA synthase
MSPNPYKQHLDKNPANYQPLTPLSFLERAATVFPGHTAVVHGTLRFSYREFYARARRLASALAARGIGPGSTVSAMLPNTPAMLEAHYAVPMTGGVLNALNTRLDAALIAFQLDHADAKVVICDREFAPVMRAALAQAKVRPLVIDCNDSEFPHPGEPLSATDYEAFLAKGDPGFRWRMPPDEWDSLSLNYTSGTTGNPKGVVYSHRGAALMCYANVLAANLGKHPVYLWTDVPLQRLVLPLDHRRGCRHPRVPAPGARQAGVRCDRRAQGHAPVRGADRHVDFAQRQRRGEAPTAASRAIRHRRCAAAGGGAGRDG